MPDVDNGDQLADVIDLASRRADRQRRCAGHGHKMEEIEGGGLACEKCHLSVMPPP